MALDIGIIFVRGGIRYSAAVVTIVLFVLIVLICAHVDNCSGFIEERRRLWSSSILGAVLAAAAISAVLNI